VDEMSDSMELTPDSCINLMPELKGLELDIQELKGGITNKLYRVKSSDGGDYVFRIYGGRTDLFIDRDVETENLRRMEPSGITPKLIRYLPEQNTTIVEFIPGYVLENQDFLKESLLELIIRPIRIIHRSGIRLPFSFDPLTEVKRFHRILERLNPNSYSEFDIQGSIRVLERISEICRISRSGYVPCHNDLLADNFILSDGSKKSREPMCLIDWEYAGMSTPYYDIADMFQEILVPIKVERGLLDIYWDNKDVNYHGYMTDLLKPFPDIYWFLWSLIQLNISAIPFDYYNYGRVKYENAQKNISYCRDHYNIKM
jgi:thiamine kinase-like enzyme